MITGLRKGTSVTGAGSVIFRDVTVHGLHRMCVEQVGQYPDLEIWAGMIQPTPKTWLHDYRERMNAGIVVCHLWIYWKEQS